VYDVAFISTSISTGLCFGPYILLFMLRCLINYPKFFHCLYSISSILLDYDAFFQVIYFALHILTKFFIRKLLKFLALLISINFGQTYMQQNEVIIFK
jgi:type IV secretory pathway TrbL component